MNAGYEPVEKCGNCGRILLTGEDEFCYDCSKKVYLCVFAFSALVVFVIEVTKNIF